MHIIKSHKLFHNCQIIYLKFIILLLLLLANKPHYSVKQYIIYDTDDRFIIADIYDMTDFITVESYIKLY